MVPSRIAYWKNEENRMTGEAWEKEYSNYKSLIDKNDFDSFKSAIKSEVPSSSIVLDMAFAHDTLWADALIEAGYDVRANKDLLYRAAGDCNIPYVKYLLKHGADPNVIVQNGYSTMNLLGMRWEEGPKWEDMVKTILENGGDPLPEQYCWSVAKAVLQRGSKGLKKYYVDLLCEKGLLTFTTNLSDRNVLEVASHGADVGIQEYIVKHLPDTEECGLWVMKWIVEGLYYIPRFGEGMLRRPGLWDEKNLFSEKTDLLLKNLYDDIVHHEIPCNEVLVDTAEAVRQMRVEEEYKADFDIFQKALNRCIMSNHCENGNTQKKC